MSPWFVLLIPAIAVPIFIWLVLSAAKSLRPAPAEPLPLSIAETASLVAAAQVRASLAAIALDKRLSSSSRLIRLVERIFPSKDAKELDHAQRELTRIRTHGLEIAQAHAELEAIRRARQSTDANRYQFLATTLETEIKLSRSIQENLQLADQAETAIANASNALDSARSYETMDAFTSNKAISMMSTIAVQEADAALKSAYTASQQLLAHIGENQSLIADTTDFIFDMAIDFPIDFMSFMTLDAISKATDQLDRLSSIATPAIQNARILAKRANEREAAIQRQIATLLKPHRAAAIKSLPKPLSELLASTNA